MGVYDQPAMIDYILNITGQEKLSYIGHSEGTTQMFIGASLKPDYFKQKVEYFTALAPIVRLDHSKNGAMVAASQIIDPLTWLIEHLHLYNLVPRNGISQALMGHLCKLAPHLCIAMNEGFFDFNNEIDNASRVADKFAHSPSGSGWRNLVHYGQIIKAK